MDPTEPSRGDEPVEPGGTTDDDEGLLRWILGVGEPPGDEPATPDDGLSDRRDGAD